MARRSAVRGGQAQPRVAGSERAARVAPDEVALDSLGQVDLCVELARTRVQADSDLAAGMRDRSRRAGQAAEERPDDHAPEAGRRGVDAEYRPEQLEVRACTP